MSTISDVPARPDAATPTADRPPVPSGRAPEIPAAAAAVDWYARDPERVAVIDADGAYGYRWLARAVDRVARTVAQRYAPQDEHLGITRRPTAAFVATVLGCMKAAVTYSVVDPDGPVAAQFLGVSTVLDARPAGAPVDGAVDLSEVLTGMTDPADAAGADPAGADPPTRMAPLADDDWAVARFGLGADDRFAVLSGLPGYLVSAVSSAMCAGATLLVAVPALAGPRAMVDWLHANGVTVVFATTPVLRAIAAHAVDGQLPALRYAFVDNSGQLLAHDVEALRRVSPSCHCVGTYRMSRAGRPVAVYAVPDGWRPEDAPLRLPLGTAYPGDPGDTAYPSDTARLLGAADRPVAVGEVGELCLGSYRTGDLARRWPDGTLEFVGLVGTDRNADPIETVAALRDLPDVRDAAVAEHLGPAGEPVLVGYVTGPDPTLDTTAVRRSLSLRLPQRLVPEHLLVVEELPLTAVGDYDLDALLDIVPHGGGTDDYVAPRTPLEHDLTGILQELLGAERVGVLDSFFELGGFSLLATQLATRIRESFGVELSLRDVFEAPTVDRLAQLIVQRQVELSGARDLAALLDEIEGSDPGSG